MSQGIHICDLILVEAHCKTREGGERILKKLKECFIEYFEFVPSNDPREIYCLIHDGIQGTEYSDLQQILAKDELVDGEIRTYNLKPSCSMGMTDKGWESWGVYGKYERKLLREMERIERQEKAAKKKLQSSS